MSDTATIISSPTEALTQAGVSIWLDDINRENLHDGKLAGLIKSQHVVGVTTNPTIFATALARGDAYDPQIVELRNKGVDLAESVFEITTRDVRDACDLFMDVYEQTRGYDGRVSIEVSPENAHDTAATVAEAKKLWAAVDRPNVMIKIPATVEGLPAISAVIAEGISVNVTLIFGLDRYQRVIDAYLDGLDEAQRAGRDLSQIHSVASFFVSRVDTEVNKQLKSEGGDVHLLNQAAVANARLAYQVFQQAFRADHGRDLLDRGANYQRPLWASTGTKTDDIPDTFYVTELVAPQTVNTMPEKTLLAVADHGEITGDSVTYRYEAAEHTLAQLAEAGIDMADVADVLEAEGVQKFIDSWGELGNTVRNQLAG